jgi:glycosyltransferase involved in cell wall biosynthesis
MMTPSPQRPTDFSPGTPQSILKAPACTAATPGHVDRPIRVCHVSMCLLTGGLERLLVEFSRLHDTRQFAPQFVALDQLGAPAEDIVAEGCLVTSLGNVSGRWARLRRLSRLFRKHEIDLVHTHNTYAHFYAAPAARWANVPAIINTQHGRGCGSGWKAQTQFRIANRFADRVVGVSQDAARMCRDEDPRSAHNIMAIHNGIDVDRFTFHGPNRNAPAITVARLSREKDFPTLLRAVQIAIADVPDFRLRIVGDGAERQALENLSHELQIDDHIEFLGERNDVPSLLSQSGFFVSSSLTEGISLTLLEAMSVGLPVLATAVGGTPEIVVEDQTGCLVPASNPAALAAAIVRLCNRRDEWPAMGHLGRQRVEQSFSIRTMIREYESLYRDCLDIGQPDTVPAHNL